MSEILQQGMKHGSGVFERGSEPDGLYARDKNGEERPSSDDDSGCGGGSERSESDRDDGPPSIRDDRSSDEGAVKSWEDPEKGWSR